MELSGFWTCSCGATNTTDVFSGVCWKCGISWADPLKVETAAELNMCTTCKATDGFHTISCLVQPLPEWAKK